MTPTPADADRLARTVLRGRLNLRAKENVVIEAYPSALPWATGFVREARRIGAHPLLHYEDERSYWSAVDEGRSALIGSPGKPEWAALEETDAYIYFWGPEDMARRSRLPEKTQEALTAFNLKWYDVARKARLRGARMFLGRVTEPNARLWGTTVGRWEREVAAASLQDPSKFHRDAARVQRALARGRSLRLRHSNGTDLSLGLRQRPVQVTLGEIPPRAKQGRFGMLANVPDATVYAAVDEETAEGTFVGNRTTSCFGVPQRGGNWTFEGGRLRGYRYSVGGDAFARPYRGAGRGKDRPSFIEVGLDPSVRTAPMLEELERGAVTVGVGRNAPFGGKTQVDFLAYLTIGGAELSVDGRTLVKGGRIVGG
jgi:leucyl aminopeptidase (aminopeptidase T)